MTCDFLELAAPGVRGLTPYQPGKPESELAREFGLDEADIVKLASNENPLGPSPRALAAIQACLGSLHRYPDGGGYLLKSKISEKFGLPLDGITLGNGSNDLLDIIARTFLTPVHNAVMSAHAFAVYPIATQAVGAELRVVPANAPDHEQPYGHDLAAMRARIDERTRVVWIANPNNPTGTWLDPTALEDFVAGLPPTTVCVLDEAYIEFMDPALRPDSLHWVARYPQLIVTRTFAKAYGLPGVRVGYALAHAQVTDLLNRVRAPFNVNTPALVGAAAALDDEDYVARGVANNRAGMAQWQQGLRALGLGWLPSAGNFLCVDLGRPGLDVFKALLPKGVIVRPVTNYGLPNFVRITIGTERENAIALRALGEVLGR